MLTVKSTFFSPCLLYNHRVHGGEFRWGSVTPEHSYSFSDVCLYIPEESLNKLPIQQPPPVSTSKGGNGSVSICKKDPHPDAENQQCYSEGKFFFFYCCLPSWFSAWRAWYPVSFIFLKIPSHWIHLKQGSLHLFIPLLSPSIA